MRLLLDTHALLWGFMYRSDLARRGRAAIRSPDDQIFVSVASLWEIAIKMRNGKLSAPGDLPDLIRADPDYELLPILQEHAWQVRQLPRLHRDPFDQLLVAQAVVEDLTIVTHDRVIAGYAAQTILIYRYETPVSIASRTRSAVRATPSLDLIRVQVLAMVL